MATGEEVSADLTKTRTARVREPPWGLAGICTQRAIDNLVLYEDGYSVLSGVDVGGRVPALYEVLAAQVESC